MDHYDAFFKRVRVNPPGVVAPALSTDGVNFDRPHIPEERAALPTRDLDLLAVVV